MDFHNKRRKVIHNYDIIKDIDVPVQREIHVEMEPESSELKTGEEVNGNFVKFTVIKTKIGESSTEVVKGEIPIFEGEIIEEETGDVNSESYVVQDTQNSDSESDENDEMSEDPLLEESHDVLNSAELEEFGKFGCIECRHEFSSQESLEEHMSSYHMNETPNENRCLICGYSNTQRKGMRWHLHQHTSFRPYKCLICSMRFLKPSTLNFHMRTHKKKPKIDGIVGKMLQQTNLEFFRNFRVTKKLFAFILRKLEEDRVIRIPKNVDEDTFKRPISAAAALLMTLSYIGRRPSFGEIADIFGSCESACHRVVWTIIYYLAELSKKYIRWGSLETLVDEEKRFRDTYHFPGIVGVLGTCRLPIKTQEKLESEKFTHCLSNKFSLQILAVCDSKGKFTFVAAGNPGGEGEDFVLHLSPLGRKMEMNPHSLFDPDNFHLVGDGRYALRKMLMVPFKQSTLDEQQNLYNKRLYEVTGVIEWSFYYLKGRFRRLELIESNIDNISPLLMACCVLHNLSLSSQEDLEYLIEELEDFVLPSYIPFDGQDVDAQALRKRNAIMHSLM